LAGVVGLGCSCGAVSARLHVPGQSAGARAVCYCSDCQSAAGFLGVAEDVLDPAGGTDIYQTTPDRLEIVAGARHLAILKLSPKGLMRWHAGCCGTPLFNTLPRLSQPFLGVVMRREGAEGQADELESRLGPVRARVFTASAVGPGAPARDEGFARTGAGIMSRMIMAWLSRRAARNPLSGLDAPVRVLTREDRRKARPG